MANPITDRDTIKSYFETGDKPTQAQFWAWMDSYFHKNDKIPIASVDGLQDTLNGLTTGTGGETYNATGDFSKTFTAGTTIDAIVFILPDGTGLISILIGTTAGGNDVQDNLEVSDDEPLVFSFRKYFKADTTWYFTNIPAGTIVKFFYK